MLVNQIQIGENIIDIKPIKMKYMKDNFYGYYDLLQEHKMNIFQYQDGIIILRKFLIAVFNNDIEVINYIVENFNEQIFLELLDKVKIINELDKEEKISKKKQKNKNNKENNNNKNGKGLTLRRGYAMLGIYAGIPENVLDECTYLYYKDCIHELSINFNWEITKHTLSQPVTSEEVAKSHTESISKNYPFSIDINNMNDKKQVAEGNTIEGLKRMGIEIKVSKAKNFVPIEEMFKRNQKQINLDKKEQ